MFNSDSDFTLSQTGEIMSVILCYYINNKRNAKIRKITRDHPRPVQKSVCEGYIAESRLEKMCLQIKNNIVPEDDSVVIYKFASGPDFEKMSIGQAANNEDFILWKGV